MFTSYERLEKRSGKKGVDRPEYLKELVHEFTTSEHLASREQVLANLVNFAYDPINYPWLRKLKVIDIFLDQLTEGTATLRDFAAAGLCNLALDQENKAYILRQGGVALLAGCLLSQHESVVLSAITTLMFLVTPESKRDITSDKVIEQILQRAESDNPRIRNLAKVFLEDYCTPEQVQCVKASQDTQHN
ncbi:armadillo repeat-containing protein 7 [Penaeus vannamei]|uniref:Armadillo repeat-containing protein 7 n=1 Tax=Penaeus vannamei TaxID=6689 RepID=A0A3G2LIW8_PENVA|nr:armadillo repeat-containing protein 7 [Penaeus vannamei]